MVTLHIPTVCSKPVRMRTTYYPWSGSHGQLFRRSWASSARHSQANGSFTLPFTPEANPKVALNLSPIHIHMGAVAGTVDETRQDNFITFTHNTLMTNLAPQVAKANRGGPGTIRRRIRKSTVLPKVERRRKRRGEDWTRAWERAKRVNLICFVTRAYLSVRRKRLSLQHARSVFV